MHLPGLQEHQSVKKPQPLTSVHTIELNHVNHTGVNKVRIEQNGNNVDRISSLQTASCLKNP